MSAQDDYETLNGLAERMVQRGEMKEEIRDTFIQDAMSRLGHKMKALWEDGDDATPTKGATSLFGDRPKTVTSGGQYR